MPSLIDMRRRIRAVKSTQQITKAMKMVAASKLRRAQASVLATRPFASQARAVLASVAARIDETVHPLLARRPGTETGPTLLIVIAADRGLCGSFNTNVMKAVGAFLREQGSRPVTLGLVGRKSRDFLGRRGLPVRFDYVNLPKAITFAEAEAIAAPAIEDYVAGKFDSVHLVYNEFKSVMQQRVLIEQLLPQLVQAQVLRALLESNAAFFAAQMTAMDAATRNSAEMIEDLTLYMNKLRQAAITREIIEVVSGAQAQ